MFFENLKLAMESLKSNIMRTLLTMLGIIIGIASVIGIMSIGSSMTEYVTKQMSMFGATNVYVQLAKKSEASSDMEPAINGVAAVPSESDLFTEEQIRKFADIYSNDIQEISYSESAGSGTVRDGKNYANTSVLGCNTGYSNANNIKMVQGRFINEGDIGGYKNVAVVSDKLAKSIFSGENPLMKEIKVHKTEGVYTYTIIGVYKYEKSSDMFAVFGGASVAEKDVSTQMFIPITTAKQHSSTKGYTGFTITATTDCDTKAFSKTIENYFGKFRKDSDWTVDVIDMEATMQSMKDIVNMLSIAIGIIAGISLIVGGVGVMNIMLVSVTERTREIGTRKALGAKRKHIRLQFVVEAMTLALAGGFIGSIIGIGLSGIVSMIMSTSFTIDITVIVFCMAFSMAIGVFFGFYPANKASKLDPIEALRYE
ncbi:ABC transporter permease [Clostridia bacterium]|nr:ABC transporter permease [Clostridia bacterium]